MKTRRWLVFGLCIGIGALLAVAVSALMCWVYVGIRTAIEAHDAWRLGEGVVVYGMFGWLMFCASISAAANIGAAFRDLGRRGEPAPDYAEFYQREAEDDLVVLVPSYREEIETIRQTLMSAALAEHPRRQVVLLIDDPEGSSNPDHIRLLTDARDLPGRLQALFDAAAAPFLEAANAFKARCPDGVAPDGVAIATEMTRAAALYGQAADWLDREAERVAERSVPLSHTDRCFIDIVLTTPARAWRAAGATLATRCCTLADLGAEYLRLASLFNVRFDSFERKRYVNFSHAPNKAMNLNSYMSLLGGCYREVVTHEGLMLLPSSAEIATRHVPGGSFIVTIDADSMITHDYNVRLMDVMRRAKSGRIAVAQSPYTAMPNAPHAIERAASASTDGQFFNHQGLAVFGAASWVGASALMRVAALRDIVVQRVERGHPIKIYIKDDILIEDAAATVDLLRRNWRVHHSHLRLSYSATPPDFGSLIIQRRRWANGGLLILPQLLGIIGRRPLSPKTWFDAIIRVPTLTSAATNGLFFSLMTLVPFDDRVLPYWVALLMVPSLLLTTLDLVRAGYHVKDLFAVQALSVVLVPANLAGTWQSLRQAMTGQQIPFARTPKIAGRTHAPRSHLWLVLGFMVYAPSLAAIDFCFGRYSHAVFASFNAALMTYCLNQFIGFRTSLVDLGLTRLFNGWRTRPRPLASFEPRVEGLEGSS